LADVEEPRVGRREFLSAVTLGLASAAALPSLISPVSAEEEGRRYAILYDSIRCIGCNACSVACKTRRGFPHGVGMVEYELSPTNWVFVEKVGEGPVMLRRSCMHCGTAMCQLVCPVGAISKWNGLVHIDPTRCIGCRYCVQACPYGVPKFNDGYGWGEHAPPGVTRKCDGCYEFVKEGKLPACVEVCPAGALKFGPRDEIVAEAQRRVAEYGDAWIYGLDQLGGLGVIYIFKKGFDPVASGVFPDVPSSYPDRVSYGPVAVALAAIAGLLTALFGFFKGRGSK